jgi:hypothetical protein
MGGDGQITGEVDGVAYIMSRHTDRRNSIPIAVLFIVYSIAQPRGNRGRSDSMYCVLILLNMARACGVFSFDLEYKHRLSFPA